MNATRLTHCENPSVALKGNHFETLPVFGASPCLCDANGLCCACAPSRSSCAVAMVLALFSPILNGVDRLKLI